MAVIPFRGGEPTPAQRFRLADERMELAKAFLEDLWDVHVQWGPPITLLDEDGDPLPHPVGCLMEILWLIQQSEPGAPPLASWGRRVGGTGAA